MLDLYMNGRSVERIARSARAQKPSGVIRLRNLRDLVPLSERTLVDLHNSFTTGLAIQHFASHEEAIRKTWPLVRDEVLSGSTQSLSHEEEKELMSTATETEGTQSRNAAKKATKKAEKAAKPKREGETPVVKEVIRMMKRKNGATKEELCEALKDTAKPGYVNALLSRILKEKGYTLTSEAIEGSRAKRYFVSGEPAKAEA